MNKLKKAQSGKRTTRKKQKHINKKTKRGGATKISEMKKMPSIKPMLPNKQKTGGGTGYLPDLNTIYSEKSYHGRRNYNDNGISSLTSDGRSGYEVTVETNMHPIIPVLMLVGVVVGVGGYTSR